MKAWILAILCLSSSLGTLAEQCGRRARDALCPNGQCCSEYGYCGDTEPYCKIPGCQSQCDGGGGGGGVDSLVSRALFDQMLKHRNGFYTYDAFVAAAKSFNGFATTGDANSRKREVAAFLAQTSHETTGGWPAAPDGPDSWGYFYIEEQLDRSAHCTPSNVWPCAPGKNYYGRGPIQITHNYNYGPAGRAIGVDLLNNPDLVATDPTISFKTALWFWITSQPPKPSCHDVITEQWTPSATDKAAGRLGGYGVITNIINGGKECDQGYNRQAEDRSGYYKRYCGILGVSYGGDDKLICDHQKPFGTSVDIMK